MTETEVLELYGKDAAEWLKRWDDGKTVWTIEMGGLGPGYEQCIAILTAEILRIYLDKKYDFEKAKGNETEWDKIRNERDAILFAIPAVSKLGVSGAQMGAAANLAGHLYCRGPAEVMQDDRTKKRHIQVCKNFPL